MGEQLSARAHEDSPASSHLYPRGFTAAHRHDPYLTDAATSKLAEFFCRKGLAALKDEDRREQWYADWIEYQAQHRIYASVLSPQRYSSLGNHFDLLRYARFLEVFAYFSPGHGYSAQVTFLGLFGILLGSNEAIKRDAVAALEDGGLFAFGVSEKAHGSDLLASDFSIRPSGRGRFVVSGTKHYIGNANVASIIPILAKCEEEKRDGDPPNGRRVPFELVALRAGRSRAVHNLRKIRTLGVRAGYVGAFEVNGYELDESDIIAKGRQAWGAVLGTVTLGKFFLGFGSIGICEHAFEEALNHLRTRVLYGKPAIEMPHLHWRVTEGFARLTAMKLYAYRAVDYLRSAHAQDRRYLLFCAVQKARVSTEGVKVMALLSECVAAKGFEADSYFEMALRDIQLIPSLESSTHINLGFTAQFCGRYFGRFDRCLTEPDSSVATGATATSENGYLAEASNGAIATIAFPPFLRAYAAHKSIPNVRLIIRQARQFRRFLRDNPARRDLTDMRYALALGQCLATIAYGQLIAEQVRLLAVPASVISAIFHTLVSDFSGAAMALASLPQLDAASRRRITEMVIIPQTTQADWDSVAQRMDSQF